MTANFPKACGCGRAHTPEDWRRLAYRGEIDTGDLLIELRWCVCGSMLAIVLGDSPTRQTLPPVDAA